MKMCGTTSPIRRSLLLISVVIEKTQVQLAIAVHVFVVVAVGCRAFVVCHVVPLLF